MTTKTTVVGAASNGSLTVSYDANSKSYTIASGGTSETFAPVNVVSSASGETRYAKQGAAGSDYLTLATTPYTGTIPNKYVGLGFWQRNSIEGSRQDSLFDVFTYGFPTLASATPRAGAGNFTVDVFGLVATPGLEPRVFQGQGGFNIDFGSGVFATDTYVTETGLLSGSGAVGGSLRLIGAGHLSANDGSFSGNMLYGSQSGQIAGTMSGRFYGPAAEEVGATFFGGTSDGATVTGGLTGQRNANLPPVNLTLTNLVAPQLFFTQEVDLTLTQFDPGSGGADYARSLPMISQLNRLDRETFSYGPGISDLPGGTFTITSKVSSPDPNFDAYQKSFNGQDVRLEFYRPGAANTELALTYASFGRWSSSSHNGVVGKLDWVHFVYGLATPTNLLSAKTGTGHYAGVVYGTGASPALGLTYDVRGTSAFDVDFGAQSYSGALTMIGTAMNSGRQQTDFGTFTFASNLSASTADSLAELMQGGTNVGRLTTRFYGPDGEEVGGPFEANLADTSGSGRTTIAGIAIAKRP